MSKPAYVTGLEAAYGAPSQAGFGSAVFYEQVERPEGLEQAALQKYRYFVGNSWTDLGGEQAWLSAWKQVYARPVGAKHDIVAELRGITDPVATLSTPIILEVVADAESARQALSAAYDDQATQDLIVYTIGDSAAMSGLLVAGRRSDGGATFLVFILD